MDAGGLRCYIGSALRCVVVFKVCVPDFSPQGEVGPKNNRAATGGSTAGFVLAVAALVYTPSGRGFAHLDGDNANG